MKTKLRKISLQIFIACTCLIVLLFSCRKVEFIASDYQVSERFFKTSANVKPELQRVVNELKRQNSITGFIGRLATMDGFARWDKAQVSFKKNVAAKTASRSMEEASADTIVIIPLVLDGANEVNAFIVAKINNDMLLKLFEANDYKELLNASQGMTADELAQGFMKLDYIVFGYKQFEIIDLRLFKEKIADSIQYQKMKADWVPLDGPLGEYCGYWIYGTGELDGTPYWYADDGITCDFGLGGGDGGFGGGGGGGGSGSGGDGSGGGGGGEGGGSGGSGSGDPCNPNNVIENGKLPCSAGGGGGGGGTGWTPIEDQTPLTATDSLIIQKLYDDNAFMKKVRDSAWSLAITNNWEYTFYIGEDNNSQKHIVGFRTDKDPNNVNGRPSTLSGLTPLADYHCHQDSNSLDRHAHDPNDLKVTNGYARFKNQLYFRSFVDMGDVMYAVVNEDLVKLEAFFKTHDLDSLQEDFEYNFAAGVNKRDAMIRYLKNLLGNSSVSGLGLYVSIGHSKLIFQKLN